MEKRELIFLLQKCGISTYNFDRVKLSDIRKVVESQDATTAKMALKNYDAYAKRVADAYLARPSFEAEYAGSWRTLAANIKVMYKRLQSQFTFDFVENDPYTSFKQMSDDVKSSGVLKIYTGFSEHPIWTPEENHLFRAVHDALGHMAGYKKNRGHAFTLRGELGVYNRQIKVISPAARVALFTEIVGQVCTSIAKGGFPPQKVCALHGFDYVNVGMIDEEQYKTNFEG
jgi:hypothetical protein